MTICLTLYRGRHEYAGCDYYPRARGWAELEGVCLSVLSCTARGFSCVAPYGNNRWALTPPFHPYPAYARRYIFCDTIRRPRFSPATARAFARHAAFMCSDFPLTWQSITKPAVIDHDPTLIQRAANAMIRRGRAKTGQLTSSVQHQAQIAPLPLNLRVKLIQLPR